jgi:hypothetical protein
MKRFTSQKLATQLLATSFAVAGLAGCGSTTPTTSSTATLSPRVAVAGVTNALSLNLGINLFKQLSAGPSLMAAGDYDSASAAEVSSLQYYITRIQFCNDLVMGSGSGYSGMTGCIDVFGTSASDNAYTTYKIAEAEADTTTTNWIDVMSKTSLDAFAQNSTAAVTGTYNYVVIESRKPVRLNAAFTVNGAALKTCTGGTVTSSGSDTSIFETRTVTDMTTCTRATTTIGSNGGGNFFKLANPVTVEAGKTYVLDLGFDAAQAVWGGNAVGLGTASYKDTIGTTRAIIMPALSIAPVLRESTKKLIREQYEIAVGGSAPGTLRVNLYYAGALSDVGTGSVQGIETRFIQTSSTITPSYVDKATSITDTSGTIDIKNWAGTSIVSSLVRSTTQTAGGTSTATVNNAAITVGTAYGTGTQSVTATFKGVTEL